MTEYALMVGGVFREIRVMAELPPAISHKQIVWYPVVRGFGEAFEGLAGNEYRITTPEPEPADPGMTPPYVVAAAFDLVISDGDISSIGGAFNLIGALYLDVGQYMLLFLQAEPDADYFGQIVGGAPCMQITETGSDYLLIEARAEPGGAFVDPERFNIQVYRI